MVEISSDEGTLSEETTREIEKSLEDVRAGRILSMKEVEQRLRSKL